MGQVARLVEHNERALLDQVHLVQLLVLKLAKQMPRKNPQAGLEGNSIFSPLMLPSSWYQLLTQVVVPSWLRATGSLTLLEFV